MYPTMDGGWCERCCKQNPETYEELEGTTTSTMSFRQSTPLEILEARVDALTKSLTILAIVQAVCAVGLLIHVII